VAKTKAKPIVIGEKGNEATRQFIKANDVEEVAILETPKTIIEDDPGKGRAIVRRRFTFRLPPSKPGDVLPTNEELLNFHKGRILSFIWKDHLVANGEMRISRKKKAFHIMIDCVPALGHVIVERPKTVNQILKHD
jgi:hypothetical protein